MDPETFRRVCMSFDALVVGFGMSRVLVELQMVPSPAAYGVLATVAVLNVWLLRQFFLRRAPSG